MKDSTISVKLRFSLTLLPQAPQCDFSSTWTPGNQDGKQVCNTVAMSVLSLASLRCCELSVAWSFLSLASKVEEKGYPRLRVLCILCCLMATPVQHEGGPLSHLQLSPGSCSHMLSVAQASLSSIGTFLACLVLPHNVPLLNLNSVSSESLVFFSFYYQAMCVTCITLHF